MDCRLKPGNDEEKVAGKADGRPYIFVIGSSFSPERKARSGAVCGTGRIDVMAGTERSLTPQVCRTCPAPPLPASIERLTLRKTRIGWRGRCGF